MSFLQNKVSVGDNGKQHINHLVALNDEDEKIDFYHLVEYYGLTESMYPMALKYIGNSICDDEICFDLNKRVNASNDQRLVFVLLPLVHRRYVKTFEVELRNFQEAVVSVGWVKTDPRRQDLDVRFYFTSNPQPRSNFVLRRYGAGGTQDILEENVQNTNECGVVDCLAAGRDSKEETIVVRSEDYGTIWYKNGKKFEAPISKGEIKKSQIICTVFLMFKLEVVNFR